MVYVSSIAVLGNNPQGLTDETMLLSGEVALDDYYRSKIDAEAVVYSLLDRYADLDIALVLPGWMHGPGDMGPTSAGRFVLDYLAGRIPGVVNAAFSLVDARDVAEIALAAAHQGRRGERYLAAGHALHMGDLLAIMAQVTGVKAPQRKMPRLLLWFVAILNEIYARTTGRAVLLSLATVRNTAFDYGRKFSAEKVRHEFGLSFRPIAETLADEVAWFHQRAATARPSGD